MEYRSRMSREAMPLLSHYESVSAGMDYAAFISFEKTKESLYPSFNDNRPAYKGGRCC